MRRLEVEQSSPYSLTTWSPYGEIPLSQKDSYFDQSLYNGMTLRLHFYQNPDWNFTLISTQARIKVSFDKDTHFIYETGEKIEGNLRDGQSYYTARIYVRDDVGSNIYPPVYRITQRWN